MDLELRGRRCIVTGASKGIGAATAEALAAEGAHVALIARSAALLLERARQLEQQHGVRAFAVPADLSRAQGVAEGVGGALAQLGGVDVLVNNAGASPFGSLEQVDDAAWQEAIELKLLGYVRAMRAVLPAMRAQRSGRIVNVLGIAGVAASDSYVLGSLNAALSHVTRSTALAVAGDGIAVLALHPGPIATERMRAGLEPAARAAGVPLEQFLERFGRTQIPVGRVGQAEEVARLIAVLASPVSGYMTGSAIEVDGGVNRRAV
jgi:NAD(P)-dependent dehydrogenase (short-subunit alcohol dehydrogenase family)